MWDIFSLFDKKVLQLLLWCWTLTNSLWMASQLALSSCFVEHKNLSGCCLSNFLCQRPKIIEPIRVLVTKENTVVQKYRLQIYEWIFNYHKLYIMQCKYYDRKEPQFSQLRKKIVITEFLMKLWHLKMERIKVCGEGEMSNEENLSNEIIWEKTLPKIAQRYCKNMRLPS